MRVQDSAATVSAQDDSFPPVDSAAFDGRPPASPALHVSRCRQCHFLLDGLDANAIAQHGALCSMLIRSVTFGLMIRELFFSRQ